jgi:hypothetical protein
VRGGRDVEEFWIEAKLSLTPPFNREQVDADVVVVKQIGGILSQEISGLFRKRRIGNDEDEG